MARIAKRPLDKGHLNELLTQLNKSVGVLTAKQADSFLKELLGPEERIMLAKRLAIIVMLIEGFSLYRTAETLKVSPATAERIKQRLDTGHYNNIIRLFKKNKKEYISVLEIIDSILHLGGVLPHYNGLERYRYFK